MLKLKKLNFKKNKRGNIQAVFTAMILLVILGIFIGFVAYIIPQVTENLRSSELNESTETRYALQEADNIAGRLDNVFLIFFAGLIIAILGSSYLIRAHPIFIPIYIFFLAFGMLVAVVGETIYIQFAENIHLSSTMAGQTFTQTILDNFPLIMLGIGLLSMIIIFSRGGENRI